jgi:SSS family solute:Na+ symporter
MWIGMTITLSFGIVFQPHMMIRYYTAVDARTLKLLGATTPIYLMTLYIPAALVGLGGALVVPDLAIPDQVFPELLFRYAPAWLTGLILAGATAAAMSTLDSILHANMTVLTRDVYQRYVRPDASQRHYVWVGRAIVMGLLLIGYQLSVHTFDFLVVLVTLSGSGALQLMPGIIGVCFPGGRTLTRAGVLAGLVVSMGVLYLTLVAVPHPLGMHGGIWALLVNTAVALGVSAVTAAPSAATVQRVHGEVERFVYGADD